MTAEGARTREGEGNATKKKKKKKKAEELTEEVEKQGSGGCRVVGVVVKGRLSAVVGEGAIEEDTTIFLDILRPAHYSLSFYFILFYFIFSYSFSSSGSVSVKPKNRTHKKKHKNRQTEQLKNKRNFSRNLLWFLMINAVNLVDLVIINYRILFKSMQSLITKYYL